jgi:hypothetical protein
MSAPTAVTSAVGAGLDVGRASVGVAGDAVPQSGHGRLEFGLLPADRLLDLRAGGRQLGAGVQPGQVDRDVAFVPRLRGSRRRPEHGANRAVSGRLL